MGEPTGARRLRVHPLYTVQRKAKQASPLGKPSPHPKSFRGGVGGAGETSSPTKGTPTFHPLPARGGWISPWLEVVNILRSSFCPRLGAGVPIKADGAGLRPCGFTHCPVNKGYSSVLARLATYPPNPKFLRGVGDFSKEVPHVSSPPRPRLGAGDPNKPDAPGFAPVGSPIAR